MNRDTDAFVAKVTSTTKWPRPRYEYGHSWHSEYGHCPVYIINNRGLLSEHKPKCDAHVMERDNNKCRWVQARRNICASVVAATCRTAPEARSLDRAKEKKKCSRERHFDLTLRRLRHE